MVKFIENSAITNRAIVFVAIMVIIMMIMIIVVRGKRKKKQQNLVNAYSKKKREEELDKLLRNEDKKSDIKEMRPYEVIYENSESLRDAEAIKRKRINMIRVQLTARTEYSTKKYFLEIKNRVSIGRSKSNEIVLDDPKVSSTHCILLNEDGLLYVCDAGSENGTENRTTLVRKYKRIEVKDNPIQINNGDKLQIAENTVILNYV